MLDRALELPGFSGQDAERHVCVGDAVEAFRIGRSHERELRVLHRSVGLPQRRLHPAQVDQDARPQRRLGMTAPVQPLERAEIGLDGRVEPFPQLQHGPDFDPDRGVELEVVRRRGGGRRLVGLERGIRLAHGVQGGTANPVQVGPLRG